MQRIRTLGQGGLGVVDLYLNTDGRYYAVKKVLQPWAQDHVRRFIREVKIMAGLEHPNIIKLVNHDVSGHNPWYVMPYYPDGSLRDRIRQYNSNGFGFTREGASAIVYHLASALSFAHKRGVLHRDLKPENVLFAGKEPVLADWGIGKFIHHESHTRIAYGIGTPIYCAPEQLQFGQADARSDIYSLGIIYRELLTGSASGTVLDPRVRAIVNRMTAAQPQDRYQSMDEIIWAVRSLNVVNEKDPMQDFWKGVAVVGLSVAGVYLISKLLGG
ncbi:MAG: serine/threonine protein kinase [Flavobacteriales bacterium]|nr:serine/threonine protein kinase [Flavobacteriales bacterium]